MTATRMPSHRRGCHRKKGHSSRASVEAHRERLIAEGEDARTLDIYACSRCRRYHVGHVGMPGRVS